MCFLTSLLVNRDTSDQSQPSLTKRTDKKPKYILPFPKKEKEIDLKKNDELYFPPPISPSEEGSTIEAILLSSLH
jgi:hypothetical protein